MLAPAVRPVYSKLQLERYFDHLCLPSRFRPSLSARSFQPNLRFLQILQRYQLANVPWENFSKFYNTTPVPVTPLLGSDSLYDKVVGRGASGRLDGRGGRGGGCFENNTLFGNVLRSLGYDVYPGAARVQMGHDEGLAWGHMVNFVHVDGKKFMVDVGFGGPGPIQPLPLDDGPELPNISPASVRLTRMPLKDLVDRSQRLWVYQHRSESKSLPPDDHSSISPDPTNASSPTNFDGRPLADETSSPDAPLLSSAHASDVEQPGWMSVYSFSEVEFTPRDFQSLAIASTFRRDSFFNWTIAASRMLMAHEVPLILASHPDPTFAARLSSRTGRPPSFRHDEDHDQLVGVINLTTNECKCTIGGESAVLRVFRSEDDRLEALSRFFGITFSAAEREGMSGTAVAFNRVQF